MFNQIPELFVADLDRFLINTDLTVKLLGQACIAEGIDEAELYNRTLAAEVEGRSYDAWEYVQERHSSDLEEAIISRFLEKALEQPIEYEDTPDFLADLETNLVPVLILTMGEEKWQTIKLMAAGLILRPYLITQSKAKGSIINSWKTGQGNYEPPKTALGISSRTVYLGDDKTSSFEGLPSDCNGYLLRRSGERVTKSQTGSLPPNVKTVSRLYQISDDLIFKTLSN